MYLVVALPVNKAPGMMRRATRTKNMLRGALFIAAIAACGEGGAPSGDDIKDKGQDTSDIQDALSALPNAEVLHWNEDGVPTYIVGEVGQVGAMQNDDQLVADGALRPALAPVLKAFRLSNADIMLRKMNVDETGNRFFRYKQKSGGLDVIGGDLVVQVDVKGAITSVNGTARGDVSSELGANPISVSAANAAIRADQRLAGLNVTGSRVVYFQQPNGTMRKAFEQIAEGVRGQDPARDKVYVDQDTGEILAIHPQIHHAENRRVYSANNGTSLPGTLRRSEGQAPTTDVDVNAAYDNTGAVYEGYANFWSRDSYDNAGAIMNATVHYSNNYCNAFWDGSRMVYGDGSGASCLPLARSVDVTAHEMTHAVTEYESGLVYSGEPGGLNESLSDIFGAFIESYVDGGKTGTLVVDSGTFLVGDEILPPFLRNMCDPAADGQSRDVWSSNIGGVDVHYSSGPSNLMFCLLSKGGMHPRGKTTNNVPAIGIDKAIRIMYKAQVDILTSNSNYAAFRTAAVSAASQLGYDQATQDAVGCAFAAIAVGTAPAACGGTNPPDPTDGVLQDNVPVTGLSDSTVNNMKFWKITVPAGQTSLVVTTAGGTGDADLYVRQGEKPTTTVYNCRPYVGGNTETCTIANPVAGDYWVGVRAYAAYSGLTLKADYSGTTNPPGDTYLTKGTPVTGISGAAASTKYWRVAHTGGNLTIRISGGTGDADLYTRLGSRPTTTTYSCRPYLGGNAETCTLTNAAAGDHYIMIRGYSAYSGVTLLAQ